MAKTNTYSAEDIEVLEGLEPVRRRPGMYIGGTDERALHHLVNEVLDNAMDEAVAGHAKIITLSLDSKDTVTISDDGRGIPVDNHPKYPKKSALEVIMTTLHSGGKFSDKAYQTSGGLHGVGISVVNALSTSTTVHVYRDGTQYTQTYSRGEVTSKLEKASAAKSKRGTTVTFTLDTEIFGKSAAFKPGLLYKMARAKAYLHRGVEIHWNCPTDLLPSDSAIKDHEIFKFPNGLLDFLEASLEGQERLTENSFYGEVVLPDNNGKVEFAVAWPITTDGFFHSYCNTIPTPQGGTHETGLRTAIARGLKGYAEMTNNKKAAAITADDILNGAAVILSVFIKDPQFQGQTKEKLTNTGVSKWVDNAIKDRFDHWLSGDTAAAGALMEYAIERAEERQRRKDEKITARKTATRKLRLPGKLADCSRNAAGDTEVFIVEGDSAGGSAKQARNRKTQAVLPLRGKILNVVSATADKIRANNELQDIILALGCGAGKDFNLNDLRYERIIIMTDADVDGAHIASLLITFFYTHMRDLVEQGHLYLAQPPLYRIAAGSKSMYAMDDAELEKLKETEFKGKKADISRFKGLGEMPAKQLKETTMDPASRTLLRVTIPDTLEAALDEETTDDLVDRLMGKNAEARFNFIQANAQFVRELDV